MRTVCSSAVCGGGGMGTRQLYVLVQCVGVVVWVHENSIF